MSYIQLDKEKSEWIVLAKVRFDRVYSSSAWMNLKWATQELAWARALYMWINKLKLELKPEPKPGIEQPGSTYLKSSDILTFINEL